MNPAALREQVTLSTVTPGKTGPVVAFLRTQRCALEPPSGREVEVAAAQQQVVELRATFRRLPVVAKGLRLQTSDGRHYNINTVLPYPDRQVAYLESVSGSGAGV